MNIAFDSEAVMGFDSVNRGIGNYTVSQIKRIVRKDRQNSYYFFNVFPACHFFDDEIRDGLLTQVDYCCIVEKHFIFDSCPELFEDLVKKFIKEYDIQLFYVTSPFDYIFPPYFREWFGQCRVCATVYDVIPYVMREHYLADPNIYKLYMDHLSVLRDYDKLLAISQSAKDDLCSYLDFPAEQIDVIWGAVGDQYRKMEISSRQEKELRSRYGIDSPFVMCTGGDDERKNISSLIRAFSMLPKELLEQYQLVVVCKLSPDSVNRYTALADDLGISDRLILTNFVPDEDLLALYNLASLVAFPSLYEGFGLPVVEAWSCGTAVLTSDNSSLAQIGEGAAILVHAESVESIAEGLRYALAEADLSLLAQKGEEKLALYNWDSVAELILRSFSTIPLPSAKEKSFRKQKLAFFTPLPPVQSGISDYSVDILRELSLSFNIDVYIDDGYEPDCVLPASVRIFPYEKYPENRKNYCETVFQVGNSDYHIYMWNTIRTYGGLLVLHDYNMRGVVEYQIYHRREVNDLEYKDYLLEDYSSALTEQYLQVKQYTNALPGDCELNGFLTNYVHKIIVHSEEAQKKLLCKRVDRSVRAIPHYAMIEPAVGTGSVREKLALREDALIFAAFGHIHTTKRIIPILHAFSRVCKASPNCQLILVGKLSEEIESAFYSLLNELNLRPYVKVTGYTTLEEFSDYMDASDICLNLRWPYNGETSGSLMRLLAKGKCVVVNDIGSFSEIPDPCCIKLPSAENLSEEEEIDSIYSAMKLLIDEPTRRIESGKAARKFAEEQLDIRKVVKQYADFICATPSVRLTNDVLNRLRGMALEEKWNEKVRRSIAHTLAFIYR